MLERRIVAALAFVDDLLHERQFQAVARLGRRELLMAASAARKAGKIAALQASLAGERGEAFPVRLDA